MIHPPKQDESQIRSQGNPSRFRFKPKRFSASANAEGGNVASAAGAAANAADAAVSDAQALVGETIATADAAVAGTIRSVSAAPNGMIDVRLSVNGGLGVDPRTVTLRMSADAAASGSITLPMTAAEFVSRLEASAG
ncbi:MAG: hypothetical protein GKR99_11650 [Rhodobacteraceae bacterium]|nr:hypothetical protein [Paracoccaceae bacterium]